MKIQWPSTEGTKKGKDYNWRGEKVIFETGVAAFLSASVSYSYFLSNIGTILRNEQ